MVDKTYTNEELQEVAYEVRQDVINMLMAAGSGHSAGPLGLAEILTVLYLRVMNVSPEKVDDPERDRFVLSCGHVCPAYYAVLAHSGFIEPSSLSSLRQFGSILQGHPDRLQVPGIETSSGPLGQGLSQAIGMALAGRLDGIQYHVYCLMSDGEQQEGQVWEAVMLAGREKLNNLTVLIDSNNIQISGPVSEVLPIEPLRSKYEAFNWHVLEIDGNSVEEIIKACEESKSIVDKPVAIIAHTIPGKGVGFMEGDFSWHGKVPQGPEQAQQALESIRVSGVAL